MHAIDVDECDAQHGQRSIVKRRLSVGGLVVAVRRWKSEGRTVLLADSGRPFFDPAGLTEKLRFDVDVPLVVEGVSARTVRVFS